MTGVMRRQQWSLGDGVELRVLGPEDVDELFRVVDANREHLRAWLPWVDGTRTPADTARFVHAAMQQATRGDGFQATVRVRGLLAGVVGFTDVDWVNRSAAIGYWLARAHQGKGLVTRAVERLVSYAFSEMGLHRVEIRCATANRRSRAIPERLGFREEGVLRGAARVDGRFTDVVVYGAVADAWTGTDASDPA